MKRSKDSVVCPDCGQEARIVGPIPATDVFAGNILNEPLAGGYLYRCKNCFLGFRWPRLSKSKLDELYQRGAETNWTSPSETRFDWRVAKQWVEKKLILGKRILDVGCFDGGFLEGLVNNYAVFGIEIHKKAAEKAGQKGVTIVGNDFSEITGQYDFVTAFDVIEHVDHPARFLSQCLDVTCSGGHVVISSGNLDSFTFRMLKSKYWYCTIAEHISFISLDWFLKNKSQLGFEIENKTTFSHNDSSNLTRVKQAILNCLYWMSPLFISSLRKFGFGRRNIVLHPILSDHPPSWITANDHVIILLRKL
jgi:2-polyprenyl-3-methyl-5-hydroxy-6-metoxy-1,4-benzoquinol methylase